MTIQEKGKLYIVATPIGNLADMTFRAVDTLIQADAIACEDTRVTRKLLQHYDIDTPTVSHHQHTKDDKTQQLIDRLCAGESIALVTDAGTPGVSDPGNKLVAAAVDAGVAVEPIPGASALAGIVSVAGIDMQQFLFLAYPPHKKGRQTFFERVVSADVPVVYYDSVHRVVKNLLLLQELLGEQQRRIIVGREMTKIHEEIVRGTLTSVIAYFDKHPDHVRGEFAVIVY